MQVNIPVIKGEGSNHRSRLVLHFPPTLVEQPIVCQLVKKYDLDFIILRADVELNKKGLMVLELQGREGPLREGIVFLQESGILVQSLSQDVSRLDDRCTHCGACITICPSEALYLDRGDRKVYFDQEHCIACELCIKGCPVRAMEIRF